METNRAILAELETMLAERFVEVAKLLPMDEKQVAMYVAAYRDGVRAGIHHTVEMLGVTVRDA